VKNLKQVMAVVLASEDGESGWTPLRPEEVPAWVRNEDVMGRLLYGEIAQDSTLEDKRWFRAERLPNKAQAPANDAEGAKAAPVVIMPARMPVVAHQPLIVPDGHERG
jgi:hypothetical protein